MRRRTLCKHGVSEIVFVVIKQASTCITTLIVSVQVYECLFFVSILSRSILCYRSKSAKMSISVIVGSSLIHMDNFIPLHLTEMPPIARQPQVRRLARFSCEHNLNFLCVNKKGIQMSLSRQTDLSNSFVLFQNARNKNCAEISHLGRAIKINRARDINLNINIWEGFWVSFVWRKFIKSLSSSSFTFTFTCIIMYACTWS